jgi:hypothetical protein
LKCWNFPLFAEREKGQSVIDGDPVVLKLAEVQKFNDSASVSCWVKQNLGSLIEELASELFGPAAEEQGRDGKRLRIEDHECVRFHVLDFDLPSERLSHSEE